MKKTNIITALLLVIVMIASSCSKTFDNYAVNNNQPTTVPAYLLLRNIENNLVVFPGGDEDKRSQYTLSTYTYYGDNQYWSGSASLQYNVLNDINAMEKEAVKASGASNPYSALAKLFKAYIFYNMTMKVGDLPMSEALQGTSNPTPKYDNQKQIFVQCLQLLEDANTQLASLISSSNNALLGDFYYKERISDPKDALTSLKQWQKVVNTFKLRILINLSKKSADADLNIKQKFADVVNNPSKYPIMTSLSDNWEYVYNSTYNYYPNNKGNYGNDATRLCVAATWLNTLSSLNDLRAMKVADPARGLGFPDTSYKSFVGGANGADMSTLGGQINAFTISPIGRKRYYDGFTGENTFIVGYPEMCLNIAEAINRGWVTGTANTWYQNGIKAMFAFYGVNDGANTVSFLKGTAPGDYVNYNITFNYADYFNQNSVKLLGDANDLTKILTQRYLSLARNSGYEGYYQWRRTGIPTFSTGAGVGNGNAIPLRFQYPSSEYSTNSANVKAAVQSQYTGTDGIFQIMWILQ
ncbi:MAG: SusD/RagB family nutrient-binding outer membrane lipoprotein [Chitinophagia bacterium]